VGGGAFVGGTAVAAAGTLVGAAVGCAHPATRLKIETTINTTLRTRRPFIFFLSLLL
jgi:hypothetical protein